jgi:hypothetical protein
MTAMFGVVTLRASLGATLAVLGALGAIVAGSHVANASNADDTFTVTQTQVTPGGPYQVLFETDSPTTPGLDGMSVAFMNGSIDVYNQELRALPSHTDPNNPSMTVGMWVADIPAGASGLPLGIYTMTLNGTFADGGTDSVATGVTVPFLASSAVTLSAASTSLSYPNNSTTLSGQVTLTNPDGTADTVFPAGLEVAFQEASGTLGYARVASDGSYSYPISPAGTESFDAEVVGYATVEPSAPSAAVTLTVTNVTPTLKLNVNPVTETYGKPVTVTGTLTYGADSAPVAGQHVEVIDNAIRTGDTIATVITAANGSFSFTLSEVPAGATVDVLAAGEDGVAAVTVPLTLKVVHPTTITGFKTTLNQNWGLSVSGCLGFPASDKTEKLAHTSGLTVEYEASSHGPWKKLAAINANEPDRACGTGGIEFSGSFRAPSNSAYYRVVYAGTAGATSYAATTSNSVLTWRYEDRITGFSASPTVVNAGGKLTIKGTLQYYYRGWHNYSGQTVVIYLHPKGSSPTWYWIYKVKTNAKGQFSLTFKDPVSATWQVGFAGNNSNGVGHLSTASPEVYVRLK